MDIDFDILRELADITDDRDPYLCSGCKRVVTDELDWSDQCARCSQERAERIAAPLN